MNQIYLDSAAMHPVLPVARDVFLHTPFGNPSSEHAYGQAARNALEQAREVIAARLYAEPDEVYFTSTATEAAAVALNTEHPVFPDPMEHHAILENVGIPSVTGNSTYCRMYANNEVGTINTVNLRSGELWLCDATAAVGHIPVSFKELGCDYLLADAIKFGGVPGSAVLIVKRGAPIYPLIRGGGQERGVRSGTENVPAICAMAAALEWQTEHMEENTQHIAALRQMMVQILSRIPDHQWNTPFDKPCLPHILNISFKGVDAHALALLLSNDGVMVSPGAACSNGLHEPSHVIMAMYHDEERARGAVRISFSHENTEDEIVEAGTKIKEAVDYLRKLG